MNLHIVYPPMDGDHGGIRLFESLDQIPKQMTRDAGYRCYTISIPDREHIDGGRGFYAHATPKEVLEELDRERSTAQVQPGKPEETVVRLLSSVAGIPATHCRLIKNPDGPLLFQVASAVDVKELWLGARHTTFDPPITLQPELYTLDPQLKPVLWMGKGRTAPG